MTTSSTIEENISTNNKLPFAVNEKSFYDWFDNLDKINKVGTLEILVSTLNIMNSTALEPATRFIFIHKLSALVFQFTQKLLETYQHSHFPFSEQDRLKIELSKTCSLEIGKSCALLCATDDFKSIAIFTPQQKALILFCGIYAQIQILLYRSVLYEKPGKGFWNSCYLFYFFAQQNNVLNIDVAVDSKQSCFSAIFKQLLIFELSNMQQFNTEEIISIYYFLNSVVEKVDLLTEVPEKKFRGIPYINLKSDEPPLLPEKNKKLRHQPYLLHVSSLKLIKEVLSLLSDEKNETGYSKALLYRLIKTLTMNQQRKSSREDTDDELFIAIGFDEIISSIVENQKTVIPERREVAGELQKLNFRFMQQNKKSVSSRKSGRSDFRSEFRSEFAVSYEDDLDDLENVTSSDIWSSNNKDAKEVIESVANARLLDKSSSGFRLRLNEKKVSTMVGDLIGLSIAETIVITVVRRIIHSSENEIQLGLEVLGNCSKILHIINTEASKGVSVLYLNNQEQVESIVIKAQNFNNEAYLFADNNEIITKYTVDKQLNASSMFKHLQVSQS